MAGRLLVGTSGWIYSHWRNVFYPPGLSDDKTLPYYSERFPTVELNYSFYKLPTRDNFEVWRQQTPAEFVFAVKASRFLTHLKKLREPAEPLDRLFHSIAGLGPKAGPLLFQLPPHWHKNVSRLVEFLDRLPPDQRYAFEFRDPSWLSEDVYLALSAHSAALVVSDHRPLPLVLAQTADFVYIRLHGGRQGPCYDVGELEVWADRVHNYLMDSMETYVYFNNDPQGCAPHDGALLTRMVADRGTGR